MTLLFATLHPATQVTIVICICVVSVAFILAALTDFFNNLGNRK